MAAIFFENFRDFWPYGYKIDMAMLNINYVLSIEFAGPPTQGVSDPGYDLCGHKIITRPLLRGCFVIYFSDLGR